MNAHKVMSKHLVLLILIGIILIAAFMRLYGLDQQSLWYDEVAEESAFQRQFLVNYPTIKPYTPPLNLFFIYPMTKLFPGSDFALRIFPFLFGLITVPLLFFLGQRIFNDKVGLITSFLLAISPFHIWYSQEARMYALQWMLSLISMIYFLRMLEQPGRKNYIGYVISTTAGLYTHQLTVFLLFLQGLYMLLFYKKYKHNFIKYICTLSVSAILYLPWIIYTLTSFANKAAGISKEISIKVILYTFYSYCAGFSIGPSLRELHLDQSIFVLKPYFLEIIILMAVFGILFMLGLWSLRKDRANLSLLLLILLIPIVGLLILNAFLPNIAYNVRYTGTALFGFLLILAKGIEWLHRLKPKIIGITFMVSAFVLITGFSAYSYYNYQFVLKYHKPDIRSAVAYINSEKVSGDAVACILNGGTINRYAKGSFQCSPIYLKNINNKEMLAADMQKTIEGKKRVWLVISKEWYTKNIDNVKEWFDTNFVDIKQLRRGFEDITNVRIYCYDLTRKKALQQNQ